MKRFGFTAVILGLCFLWFQNAFGETEIPVPGKHAMILLADAQVDGYMLWLPKGFNDSKEWPILYSLHSAAEVGGEVRRALSHGPAKIVEESTDKDLEFIKETFIIISPHMTDGPYPKCQWYNNVFILNQILDQVIKNYKGDKDRVYLMGFSTGGTGTWGYLSMNPERFAAAIPICGYTHGGSRGLKRNIIENYEVLKNMPIWVFHNVWDNTVPYRHSVDAVETIEKAGGKPFLRLRHPEKKGTIDGQPNIYSFFRFAIEESEEKIIGDLHIFSAYNFYVHDNGDTFNNAIIYKWLLSHKKTTTP